MSICEQKIKVTIFPPEFPGKLNGTYAGFTIPQGYNNNTGQSVGNRYQFGGKYIGFRPNLSPPSDNTYYNGGNSFATRNCNIILNNFEDAKYFTENKTLHDFKNGFEVTPSKIELSMEKNSSTLGYIRLPIKDNEFLKQELNAMITGSTPAAKYMIVKFEREGIEKNFFGRVEAYEQQEIEIKIFDVSDFYVKSTNNEGQTNKDQSSGNISKETALFGGMPRKDNVFFDWESFNETVEELRDVFVNPNLTFPPTDKTMNEIKHKLINEFITGSDKEQAIFYSYGVGYSKLKDYIAIGQPNQLMRPFISKDDKEQLRTFRMHGDLLDTLSSYFVYHMREPNQINTMKVVEATNDFDEKIAINADWCQTSIKDLGIGLFLVDPSELPSTDFKKFTTSAEEFGTGLDEIFRTYDIDVKWRMELREVDGFNRAVLIPYTSQKELFIKSDQIEKDFKILRNTEEHIAIATAFRTLNKEHDGNSEYHALPNVQKNFYNNLTNYETIGIFPYNSGKASEDGYAVKMIMGTELTAQPLKASRKINFGAEDQEGWAREWNDKSYLIEEINTHSNNETYGGFYRMNLSQTSDKLKNEAKDYVKNIPTKAKTRIECTISRFEKGQLPFWEVMPGDIFNIELITCDFELIYKYDLFSVQYIFEDGKEEFTIDYE